MKYGINPLYPDVDRLYVIGDIHGEFLKLESLFSKIRMDLDGFFGTFNIVLCGDYINGKGKQQYKTLLTLISLKKEFSDNIVFLAGNHEEMLQKYLNYNKQWIIQLDKFLFDVMMSRNMSHGEISKYEFINELKEVFKDDGVLDFLSSLKPYYETKKYLITHAPISEPYLNSCFGSNVLKEGILDLKIVGDHYRWHFLNDCERKHSFNKTLICGHQTDYCNHVRFLENRIFVDTSCGQDEFDGLLSAVVLPENRVIQS